LLPNDVNLITPDPCNVSTEIPEKEKNSLRAYGIWGQLVIVACSSEAAK
jgi:hypothetical protein